MEKKTIFVNLNFDDFHPQRDSEGDFGDIGLSGNLEKIVQLTDEFPGLIVSLFTVANWIDRPYRYHRYNYFLREILGIRPVVRSHQSEPFLLSKHDLWCEKVSELISEQKIEIANHGYFHHNPRSRIHGQEFHNLSEEESRKRILLAEEEFKKNNIKFIKAFRPPGWGINKSLVKVLKELDYKIYAPLSSRSKTFEIKKDNDLIILPQNWSIRESPKEALELAEKFGAVYMKGHMVYKYGKEIIENGINEDFWQNLRITLRLLNDKYNIKYLSLEDITKHQM